MAALRSPFPPASATPPSPLPPSSPPLLPSASDQPSHRLASSSRPSSLSRPSAFSSAAASPPSPPPSPPHTAVEDAAADPPASPEDAEEAEGEAAEGEELTESERNEMIEMANAAKERGNAFFKAGEVDQAIECYSEAIELAPPRAEELATYYANRAACYAKSGRHRFVAEDCTAALAIQPSHVKALMRRAQAKEAMDEPNDALEDMKKVVELDPSIKAAAAAVPRLQRAADAKLEAQKEEMIGKLKDLGNTVLGKFGLSLNNFKAEQDPTTGSYNISFQQ